MINVQSGNKLVVQSQMVAELQVKLGQVGDLGVNILPDLTQYINHQGDLSRPSLQLAPGIYMSNLAPEDYREQLAGFSYLHQPGRRVGREMSHNNVFFGKILVHAFNTQYDREYATAIKPSRDTAALLGELAMFQCLRKFSVPSFEPAGLLVSPDSGHNYLFTHFERPVATMDTVEWDKLDLEERWAQLGLAINTMTLLHSRLLFHNDLEFRNVAFGERSETIIVDPEHMVSTKGLAHDALLEEDCPARQRARVVIKQRMSRDFSAVCMSIDEFIITPLLPVQQRTDGHKFKEYNRRLFKPYKEALQEHGSPYLELLLDTLRSVVSDHKQRARETSRFI